MSSISSLQDLGLSETESKVYLALLKTGGSTASAAARFAGLKRTTIYAVLHELTQKGFVATFYRKSRQLFYAEKPANISRYFEKKLEQFNSLIPALESLEKTQGKMLGLRYIQTLPELKRFYVNVLDEYKNRQYYIFGSAGAWQDLDPSFFIQFRKNRAKANIRTKLLLSAYKPESSPKNPRLLRTVKFLPKKYTFKSTIDIYKDKILIVSPELSSLAVVIQVPAMVDVFKAIFEMCWDFVP